MKIAVVTMYGKNYSEIANYTVDVMEEYCRRHNYNFHQIKLSDENDWMYKKHEKFKLMFERDLADVIFYCDVDTVFTNHNCKIEDLIDKGHDYFVAEDFNEINNGVLIIKNTDEGNWINNLILHVRDKYENEQNALNDLMRNPQFNQYVKILPQGDLNAYRYDLYPECKDYVGREDLGDWVEGKSFLLHVPAIQPLSKRLEILKQAHITR